MNSQLNKTRMYKVLTYTIDILLILLSVYLSFVIKFGTNIHDDNLKAFIYVLPMMIVSYIVFMFVFGLDNILKKNISEIIFSIFLTVISLLVTTSFIAFFLQTFAYPRTIILISSIPEFITLSAWRYMVWRIERKSHGIKDCIVIGNSEAKDLAKKIILKQNDLYNVKYICSDRSTNINKYIGKVNVIFISNDVDYLIRHKIINNCIDVGKDVYLVPSSYELMMLHSEVHRADDTPLLNITTLGLTIEQRAMKRLLDILVASVGLLITAPIMLIIAVITKLTDGGNMLYGQERVTKGKKKFKVLKFRTMVMNAEKLTGPVLAGEDDLRITKLGRVLRATRLDELPQFINIIKGDMSVVGPRPERPFFVEKFESEVDDYKYRTIVKGGLTGFAQIYGKYNTTAEDKSKYDLLYIKNYSIFQDLKIILLTIKIMFMKNSTEGIKNSVQFSDLIKQRKLGLVIDLDAKKSMNSNRMVYKNGYIAR